MFLKVVITFAILVGVNSAYAVPVLQLGIIGGEYSEFENDATIVSTSPTFTLVAYGKASDDSDLEFPKLITLDETFYLSIAITPQTTEPAPDIGSFAVESISYDETDLTFGIPPIEADGTAAHDGGDLGGHGIFETYFMELAFQFTADKITKSINTQDDPGFDPTAVTGTELYYATFDINAIGLSPGFFLHFDLYDIKVKNNGDFDKNNFAPFSHDAAYVPEPNSLALFAMAILCLGLISLRKKRIYIAS